MGQSNSTSKNIYCNHPISTFRNCQCTEYKKGKDGTCLGCNHKRPHNLPEARSIPVLNADPTPASCGPLPSLASIDAKTTLRETIRGRAQNVDHDDVKIGIVAGTLPNGVLEYLQQDEIFTCDESKVESLEFNKCVDYPQLFPGHKYYEGYFHCLATPDPVSSINPRTGALMDKPAAPTHMRAFGVLLRKLNASWLTELGDEVPSFRPLLPFVFADAAVQIHYGVPVQYSDIGYHFDNRNSSLHCALSIRGKRALHMCNVRRYESENYEQFVHWQQAGNFYVSSPASFFHGVEHVESTWDTRVIAVQIRILYKHDPPADVKTDGEYDFMDHIIGVRKDTNIFQRKPNGEEDTAYDLLQSKIAEKMPKYLQVPTLMQLEEQVAAWEAEAANEE